MSKMKELGNPDTKQIVILRALQLGDLLNAVPAFRALRSAFPDAHITLVGLPWTIEFVNRFRSYLDGFIPFPGFPGFPEQEPDIARFPIFLSEMQARHFDLAIQMQGSGELSNILVSLWSAKQTAGFYHPGKYCPDDRYFLEYPQNEHEIWRHLRLMEFLGIPSRGDELEFPLFEKDWKQLDKIKKKHDLRGKYVCIHPGARAEFRRWPTGNFAGVADALAARGFQVVLTGIREEMDLTRAVARQMESPAIDLAGKTDLGTLAALVSQADLVLSNDTGMSHMAAALKTPSVVLFAVENDIRWAPRNRKLHKLVWHAMEMKTGEVLAQVESHLDEIYGQSSESPSGRMLQTEFPATGGRE